MVNNSFGYSYKYASKPNGESYTLPADPNADNRFDCEQEVINNGDGTYRFTDDNTVDFSILTTALFNEDNIIDDHGALDLDEGGRGYMMDPKDWRDVEIDFEWKVTDFTSEDGWYIHLGGGRHANPQPFCEGCAYIFKIFFNGDIQWLKEQWHNFKAPIPAPIIQAQQDAGMDVTDEGIYVGALGTPAGFRNNWNLMKICRYNVAQNDGRRAVKIEIWINATGDKQTWVLLSDILDVSGWGEDDAECNGLPDQVMNWGFPMIRFFWKNATRVDWFGLTVREIVPQGSIPEDPEDPGEPEIPPPEVPTGKVSKIGSFRFSIASTLATSCDGVEPTQPSQNPDPPPDEPPPPPTGTGGTLSFTISEFFRIGS